ncbi:MAG: FlgD immunoglobulin-like domain containing protein [Armatimonadota bacterium]
MSKFRNSRFFSAFLLGTAGVSSVYADWTDVCPPPPMTNRYSDDAGGQNLDNPLFEVSMGISGNSNWAADDDGGCFANAVNGNLAGRIGFGIGPEGTVRTALDNLMSITFGFQHLGSAVFGRMGYATIQQDGVSSRFGANGFSTTFEGESDTYFYARTTNGNVQIDLRADLVGDAARLDWTLANVDAANSHTVGMRFGQVLGLISAPPTPAVPTPEYYITIPGIKPPRTERRWNRLLDPSGYPSEVNFGFSRTQAYGLRVDNAASDATTDSADPSASQTPTDGFVLGQPLFLLGTTLGTPAADGVDAFPDVIFQEPISDVLMSDSPAFIQTWAPQNLAVGGSRKVVAFYRSTWSDAQYGKPYSVVVDPPKVVNLDPANSNAFENNPFPVRVWVDNNRGFSTIDKELPLQDVRVELLLPTGLTAVGGSTRTIARIDARRMVPIDFQVRVDDFAAGDLTYQVRVTPTPGPVKTITGQIKIVSQPRMQLRQNANLVTSPWTFSTPTWETILGLAPDADFRAFSYEPAQRRYIISSGPDRGKGQWLIVNQEQAITLGGSPSAPSDGAPRPDGSGGAPLITLQPGWNLVGNPYQTSIQLGQIVGSAASNSSGAFTFAELVQQGLVSGSLAYWDQDTATYKFIQKSSDSMEPQRGYWIYVYSAQNVVIRYPAVFTPFARKSNEPTWTQSDKQWRLQLAARTNASADDFNYIGLAGSATVAKNNVIEEPPIAPIDGAISMAVEKEVNGQATRLAQSLSDKAGRQEFKVSVFAKDAGPVTVTWPNLSTIPKNIRVRLVDTATGETRDLRKVSGYRFDATSASTREFKIQVETGAVSRAVIGNVVVTRNSRSTGGDASIRLTYSLAADATTTVRILKANGSEVMTISRGRADKAGQNEVVWNLMDQANRAQPPGTYRAEIVAEGQDGERVRKIVPIVISR